MNLNRKPPQAKIRPAKRPVGRGGKHLWTSSFNADTRFIVSQNLAQEDVDQSLATICDAIVQIRQRRNSSQLSFETLYRNAYMLVLHKHGARLYEKVKELYCAHAEDLLSTRIAPAAAETPTPASDEQFLRTLFAEFNEYSMAALLVRDILMYLDRVYIPVARVPNSYRMGLNAFGDVVLDAVAARVQTAFCESIRRERMGELVDRNVLKKITKMFNQLHSSTKSENKRSAYKEYLEEPLLEETSSFFKREGEDFLRINDASSYLQKVEVRLEQEKERVSRYLLEETRPALMKTVETALLGDHLQAIMEKPDDSGLAFLLDERRHDELARFYRLFKLIPDGLDKLRLYVQKHMRTRGERINEAGSKQRPTSGTSQKGEDVDPKSAESTTTKDDSPVTNKYSAWVSAVVALKHACDGMLKQSFAGDNAFETSLNEAFQSFINQNSRAPEFLSSYVDENLKKGTKKSEEETEQSINDAVSLFRFVQDKDVFERHYKQHLAKRLLMAKSASDDMERLVIGKLKNECGFQFTTKMEGMFNDMRVSADATADFKEQLLKSETALSGEIFVNVLTNTYWPVSSPVSGVTLPHELERLQQPFTRFYMNRHSGRKLLWAFSLGSVDLRMSTKARRFEVNVSTYQSILLLLFNRQLQWSLADLASETGIPRAELLRSLQSLACGKFKILHKSPKSRDVHDGDTFRFNEDFTSPQTRIKIPLIAIAAAKAAVDEESARETRERAEEDRKHTIDAAIVRVMKSRKRLDHTNLVLEVTEQLRARFLPDPALIKRRVELLIEREYLERADTDRKMYNYLA